MRKVRVLNWLAIAALLLSGLPLGVVATRPALGIAAG